MANHVLHSLLQETLQIGDYMDNLQVKWVSHISISGL